MNRVTDVFWPTLERPRPAELEEDDRWEADDILAARSLGWKENPELALEEARRLSDSEEERRRTTESKASTYLLFSAAFAAALIPFLPAILDGRTGSAPGWLIAILLIVAVSYLVGAGVWAFRALSVGTYHRLDVMDLVKVWENANPLRALIREELVTARRNRRAINEKVSCLKMVHEFIVRAFAAFGVLVVAEAGWEVTDSATGMIRMHHSVSKARSDAVADHPGSDPVRPGVSGPHQVKTTDLGLAPSRSELGSTTPKSNDTQKKQVSEPAARVILDAPNSSVRVEENNPKTLQPNSNQASP